MSRSAASPNISSLVTGRFGTVKHSHYISIVLPRIKITSHILYCDPLLDYDSNTKRNGIPEDGVEVL